MSEVARVINNKQNKSAEVYIYKAFDIFLERENEYFQDTIEAIEKGYIDRYDRIVSLNNLEEAENLIKVMKIFSKSEKARLKAKFFVNYRPIANYISFLIVSNGDCMISLPFLEDAPVEIKGHKCGVFVKDDKIFQSFKEVFREIKKQDSVKEFKILPPNSTDDKWQTLREEIVNNLSQSTP